MMEQWFPKCKFHFCRYIKLYFLQFHYLSNKFFCILLSIIIQQTVAQFSMPINQTQQNLSLSNYFLKLNIQIIHQCPNYSQKIPPPSPKAVIASGLSFRLSLCVGWSWSNYIGMDVWINLINIYCIMKTGVFLCLVLLLWHTHSEALQLYSVSSSPTQIVSPSGSVRGGTTIYITGVGFSANAANNQVTVGTYPCVIPAAGATETTISCVTTDTRQNQDIYNLPINVVSNGQTQSLTNEQGCFSYLNAFTPIVQALFPASAVGGTFVNFLGIHRISNLGDGNRNMGDVISMNIGNALCGRFDIVQGPIQANSQDTISCRQASVQEAGKYQVREYLTPGYSTADPRLRRSSFLQENFHFAVLPAVYSFTPNSGAAAGQQLSINGSGFSTNSSVITVTVDGNPCDISSSTQSTINCNIRPRDLSLSSKLATNSGSQSNGYISGTGLNYQRYDITNLVTKTIAGLRTAINSKSGEIVLQESSYRGEISTGNYYGSNYGEAFTGYFTAPVSGRYVFRGVADDIFAVYLASTYGSTQPAATPLILSNSVQDFSNFYIRHVPTAQAAVTLQAGKSYYIQVYHINFGGPGYLRVQTQVPNSDNTLLWQTHAVQRLVLNYTNDPEILNFTQTGGTGGQINLTATIRPAGAPSYVVWAVIDYNASINQLISALNTFDFFSPYSLSGTRTLLDANGAVTADPAQAVTYIWTVSIALLRPTTATRMVITPRFINYSGTQSFTQTTVRPHGPLIVGSFGLSMAGTPISFAGSNYLRFNIAPWDLQASIRQIPGFELVEVNLLTSFSMAAYGSTWLISFIGVNGPVPTFTTDSSFLIGGLAGTKPEVYSIEIRAYSSDLLVNPIDFPFLSTPASQPNVLVTVNQLPSVCLGNCGYTFLADSPQVTAASISGPTVTLSLTDPARINYTLSDVTVTIAGQPCTINNLTSPIAGFTCQLPTNSDGTANIVAGSYFPVVTIKQTGLAPLVSSITAFDFPLVLTSLSVTSGGTNGGYNMVLTGKGFPTSIPSATISICNQAATINSISNINSQIIVPSCPTLGSTPVSISNGIRTSNTLPFTYVTPTPPATIFSVVPQSHNPSLKGTMEIRGIGFGNNTNSIRVDLANSSGKVYRMRVLTLNDTYIKVGIPGGLTGKYKVQVNLIGLGEAIPNNTNVNDFAYELIINSVTPSSGSYYGGTLINIKGVNFSPALDETLVFVGDEINWMCNVQQLNTTDILCRTPPISPFYNASAPQPVVLTNRLMVDNTCGGQCQFSYIDSSLSPKLTSMSVNSISSGSVTLTGVNFNLGAPVVVLTHKNTSLVNVVTPTATTATSITFAMPSVQGGWYDVKIRIDPVGESNGYLLLVTTAITTRTPSTVSTSGARVTISGSGLPNGWPNSLYSLKITQNSAIIQPTIFSATPSAFVVTLPSSASGDVFNVSLTVPTGSTLNSIFTSSTTNTPVLALTSSSTVASGSLSLTFSQSNLRTVVPNFVEIYSLYNSQQVLNGTITSASSGTIQVTATLTGGKYGFRFFFASYGLGNCASSLSVTISQPTSPAITASYNGGSFTLTGNGLSKSGTVKINGVRTTLVNVTSTNAIAIIPPFVTSETQTAFNLAEPQKLTNKDFSIISDTASGKSLAFDGFLGTVYTSASTGACFIGADVGAGMTLHLTRVRFFPNSRWIIVSNYLLGARLQASNDNVNWVTLANVDSTVHSGWNVIPITTSTKYRYVRLSHDATSKCSFAQIQFEGVLQTDTTLAGLALNTAQITYEDGGNAFSLANSITFREDHTPIVQTLSKTNGDVFGGYPITLNGKNLNFDTPTITIDGIACVVTSSSATSITCTVGARLSLPSKNSFEVKVGACNAILKQSFSYVMRWSDIRTWGTDMPPIDGDLVFVPAGMNLLVDQSTPKLQGILVQNGTLTFADESDMVISVGFITVVGGQFLAGTQKKPYQHQLTFILSGNYYGPQQPMFGNKGIGCMQCFISLHGEVRQFTWSMLSASIKVGDNSLQLQDAVDWRVGETIVVASTSFDHYEAERRNIVAINGKTITVDKPFKNLHFAGVQTYGNDKIQMRAQVGLLTRNIKVMGDDTSVAESYGAHLMMAGSAQNGLVGHIGYTEFTKCGQPRIIGRYCIHFHMNGDVSDSFARGNAVHDSMARVITLHGVHYLTVEYNVGYNVMGHNYFIEDGIQTNNLLQYNLAISSIQVWTMLQTDISVASFWITHPTNHFRYNHAAGSDFYGFWYEIKPNPDGPSACNDVCPIGNPLGDCHDNVAHSNVRFGLRIFKLAPRTYPCRDLYVQDQVDPWKSNSGVISTFANYTLYKNGQSGLLAEETANLVFENFTSAQNKRSGAQFWVTYFSKDLTVFKNSVIIGQTNTNSPQSIDGAKGIITPRLGNIRIDNIRFYNYPANTHSLETCSHCDKSDLFTNSAQEIYISNITFTNVNGYKLFMNGLKREILYDLDGTFTTNQFDGKTRRSAAVTYNYRHLQSEPACLPTTDQNSWDNTIICDSSVKLVRVTFKNLDPASVFSMTGLKAQEISDSLQTVPENSTEFTEIFSFFSFNDKKEPMVSERRSYAMPYIAGRIYNIWWLTGLDFDHLSMTSSYYMQPSDPAIRFRFNYTLNRQLYQIAPIRPDEPLGSTPFIMRENDFLDEASCANGEYYHDNTAGNRTLQLCASARNRTYFQTVDVKAIYCRYLCPAPLGEFVKENFVRYWSNASQWPEGRMPLPGQNVTVNGNWTIIMDVDPAPCEFMEIDGDVIVPNGADRNITCQSIWIRAGSLTAGSASAPFTNKLNIQINGNKLDPGYVFDPSLQGNKVFFVTGKLNLYGVAPGTVSAKLTKIALKGDTQITVDASSGWNVGDEIVIAPSFSNSREYERVTITAISGNTVSFSPKLQYNHYGDPAVTINNNIGTLDTRASVGHVSRNIKILSGPDSGWGYSVVVYQMWDGRINRPGQATFSGVEFTLGGQYDTEHASLVLNNNLDSSSPSTTVIASSFSYCRSFCILATSHNNAVIRNNIFYEGRKFHMKLLQISSFIVSNNVMMGAILRPTMTGKQPVACIELTDVDPSIDSLAITNNICQGSDVNGFVMPFIPCSMMSSTPFSGNTAGTIAEVGFLLIRTIDDACLGYTGVRAYAAKVGHISSPAGTARLQISNYIIADSQRGLSLRFGLDGNDRSAFLSDSYITQISRPNCAICYGSGNIDCSGNEAIRMLAVTSNGETYPTSFTSSYDGLCKPETFDSKAFLTNVVFDSYRQTYSNSFLSQCGKNVVFRSNPLAPDFVGGHNLFNCTCNNCQLGALAYFDPPLLSELGWFGGCGNMTCTGKNNYIIQDHSGTFLPNGGFLLANNSEIGDNTPGCTKIASINGHYCQRNDFGALQYESIAPDFNTRIMWPANLSFDGGNWTTLTNGFKEWQWMGSEPLNRRLARFISVIHLQKVYNLTFASNPPDDMRFQLQRRVPEGNNSDWIVVKMYYPFPNSIEVSVNGAISRPISLLDNNGQVALNTRQCGSNIFFYKNYTIHFVLTGDAACLVRVRLTSSVQLTLRFSMNINDFFSSAGPTRLVDRMCAILRIDDQSRVKIVGVYNGSTQVDVIITSNTTNISDPSASTSYNSTLDDAQAVEMNSRLQAALASGELGTTFADMGFMSMTSQVVPVKPIPSAEQDNTNKKIMIGVISSVVGLLLIVGVVIIFLKRQANNKVVDEVPEFSSGSEASHEKGKEEKAQRETIEVHNVTEDNISEVIFDRPN